MNKSILIKMLISLALLSISAGTLSAKGFPRKEFSFCPAGGPQGWMNYFDYKRNQNIWRRHNHPSAYHPYYKHPEPYFRQPSQPYYYVPRRHPHR